MGIRPSSRKNGSSGGYVLPASCLDMPSGYPGTGSRVRSGASSMADQNDQSLSGMVGQSNSGQSDYEITENADGSANIVEKKSGESEQSKAFYRNLALELSEGERQTIATSLLELI